MAQLSFGGAEGVDVGSLPADATGRRLFLRNSLIGATAAAGAGAVIAEGRSGQEAVGDQPGSLGFHAGDFAIGGRRLVAYNFHPTAITDPNSVQVPSGRVVLVRVPWRATGPVTGVAVLNGQAGAARRGAPGWVGVYSRDGRLLTRSGDLSGQLSSNRWAVAPTTILSEDAEDYLHVGLLFLGEDPPHLGVVGGHVNPMSPHGAWFQSLAEGSRASLPSEITTPSGFFRNQPYWTGLV